MTDIFHFIFIKRLSKFVYKKFNDFVPQVSASSANLKIPLWAHSFITLAFNTNSSTRSVQIMPRLEELLLKGKAQYS
jgi:hypothetical protein